MDDSEGRLAALGTAIPEISLPRKDVDLQKWAVIACDQFTQDPAYWEDVAKTVGTSPSTFHIILPERYLDDKRPDRIEGIHRTMASYLAEGVLAPPMRVRVDIASNNSLCRWCRLRVKSSDLYDCY
ncbi:hypothetical protein AGMMS49942_11770 [Spirochaetia bacterium]|nr:hypothetical protein AGMMS49942_11770 [Spirochaetia bacterium]